MKFLIKTKNYLLAEKGNTYLAGHGLLETSSSANLRR